MENKIGVRIMTILVYNMEGHDAVENIECG